MYQKGNYYTRMTKIEIKVKAHTYRTNTFAPHFQRVCVEDAVPIYSLNCNSTKSCQFQLCTHTILVIEIRRTKL